MIETPGVRDAVQRSENPRKNSFLNYESLRLSLSKLVAAAFSTLRQYGAIVELVETWGGSPGNSRG